MRNKKLIRSNDVLDDAIAHLNGYALIMKAITGYNPIAVFETIRDLKEMKRNNVNLPAFMKAWRSLGNKKYNAKISKS